MANVRDFGGAQLRNVSSAWRELVLSTDQLSNSLGILPAALGLFSAQPTAGQTIIFTDGTTTETYTAVAAGASGNQFNIAGSAAATGANFAAVLNANSAKWATNSVTYCGSYFTEAPTTAGILYRKTVGSGLDRIYGTFAGFKIVTFGGGDYVAGVEAALPASDPGVGTFGFGRAAASLLHRETHPLATTGTAWRWNAFAAAWYTTPITGMTTLAAGASPAITVPELLSTSRIYATHRNLGGAQGMLRAADADKTYATANAPGTFVIKSSSNTDTSDVDWIVVP